MTIVEAKYIAIASMNPSLYQRNFEHNWLLKALSIMPTYVIRKCKANIKSNNKHLWKIIVNDQYTPIEQSLYDRGYWVPIYFH